MLRWLQNPIAFATLFLFFIFGINGFRQHSNLIRLPASKQIAENGMQLTGSNLPEKGRSGFDIIFSKKTNNTYLYDIPFPPEKLIQKLELYSGGKMNQSESNGVVAAIFPMGRSLQRNAAVSDQPQDANRDLYFRYPRVVLGIDGEGQEDSTLRLNLKNKLYLGYNEKAEILEAISYNEELGRFEYQIVDDYAKGKIPKVRYAPRTLCLSCHQNQAPIFSKAPWSESNANPSVSSEMDKVHRSRFYVGAPIAIDGSITARLDTATDQANLIPVYQQIWKELCQDYDCRFNAVLSAIQSRLNRKYIFKSDLSVINWMNSFESKWQQQWPSGLEVPSADIANRDPFKDPISDFFEPLIPRRAVETWKNSGLDMIHGNRLTRGLSKEFTGSDIRLFDRWLAELSEPLTSGALSAVCKILKEKEFTSIDCPASVENKFSFSVLLRKDESNAVLSPLVILSSESKTDENLLATGVIAQVSEQKNILKLALTTNEKISLRTPRGYLLSPITIDLKTGLAELHMLNQFDALHRLVESMIRPSNDSAAFSRFELMKNFATYTSADLKIEDIARVSLPLEVASSEHEVPIVGLQSGFNLIKHNCSECHRNDEGTPPNFLGSLENQLSDKDLCRRLEVCAPRILYRLKVLKCDPATIAAKKTSMPPAFYLNNHNISREKWKSDFYPQIAGFLNSLVDENELARDIQLTGLTHIEAQTLAQDILTDKCPDSSSIMYDHLPKCQFEVQKTATRCR